MLIANLSVRGATLPFRGPGRLFRSALATESGDDSWLEAVYNPAAPLLVMHLDQGSCEWHGRSWLIHEQPFRGVLLPDPFHRRHNNCLTATRKSHLSSIRVSAILALNFSQGPWNEGAYQHKLRDCLQQWLSTNSCQHPLFLAAYESIALDRHSGDLPAAFGTEEHMAETYLWLHRLDIFGTRHRAVKTGRWHNLAASIDRLATTGAGIVLAGVLAGMADGTYSVIADTPLGGASFTDSESAGACDPDNKMYRSVVFRKSK